MIIDPALGRGDPGEALRISDYGLTSCDVCTETCEERPGQAAFCGDGVVQASQGEECDAGVNLVLSCPDGTPTCQRCDANCRWFTAEGTTCGDGFIEGGEDCEDGNQNDLDGCDAQCHQEVWNSIVRPSWGGV